jgi:tetratricopeptide (TPR) repeat protein
MKLKGALAPAAVLGAVLAIGGVFLGAGPAYAAPPQKLTRSVGLKLQAAQKDIQKGNYAAGLRLLDQASAMPKQTPYSRHVATQLYVFAYEKTNNYAKLAPKLEQLRDDPYTSAAQKAQFTVSLAQIYYTLHNYPKAIEYGTEAIQHGWADAQMPTLVGQSYYLEGNWRGTIQYEKGLIDAAIKQGQKPTKQALQLVQSSCQHLNDNACLLDSIEQLVVYYPQPQYWQYLIYKTLQTIKSDRNLLEAYRLAFDVGVMQQPHEFINYAELAIEANDPGEAETVLTKALQANVFTTASSKAKAERLLADAKQKAAKDLAGGLASTAEAAARQSTGGSDIRVGLAYYGYKQYGKAVQEFTQGIAKGGLRNLAEAHLLLGIAELKAGNRSAALQAFQAVKGDPTLQRLASLWSLRARSVA